MFYKKTKNKHNAIFQQHSTLFVVSDQTDSIRGIAKYKVSVTLLRLCCRFFLELQLKDTLTVGDHTLPYISASCVYICIYIPNTLL